MESDAAAQKICISGAGTIQPRANPREFVNEVIVIPIPIFSNTNCNLKYKLYVI